MNRKATILSLLAALSLLTFSVCFTQDKAPAVISALPGNVPSDAVVLFDGTGLDAWQHPDGSPASWKLAGGAMTVTEGGLVTKAEFGDVQIHLEFCMPAPAAGEGQDRGNSGIYIHGNYEVQILDSYENETYYDGQCAAVYKISPPLVNASRPPGIWQTYDIIFHAAGLDNSGKVTEKATVTVIHNGVLVQDNLEVSPTGGAMGNQELEKGPIMLQDHHHPVRFRNIWIREL
ncbi:MAG: DUF1080 domain-containing protein [Candidatus Glassbacteria bacterium]|nr:DUF1080 domain-containing protein [Candidatus Glassbacteria bacterium]